MADVPGPILITGARGMLGRDLGSLLTHQEPGLSLIALGHSELDITREEDVRKAVACSHPAAIINCAAATDVDGCERQPDLAFSVNALGPELLARAAAARRALLVHVSTDFVFDGSKGSPYAEEDPPHPLNVYGESKLAGEEAVRRFAGEHLIVRTAWLYGRVPAGRAQGNFVHTILGLAESGKELRVVTDQRGSPTWTVPLAGAIVALMRAGARGTYHAAGRGECSRYEWAAEILRLAGRKVSLVPATTAEFPRPARRPPYSALASEKLSRDTGFCFPPWQESLAEYLRSRQTG
jgi:dTDP-4-dehydrorhamnose reductase